MPGKRECKSAAGRAATSPRAVVVDEGAALWLRVYDGGRLVAQVPLDARRAARLAADLALAAARRVHDVPNRKGDRE